MRAVHCGGGKKRHAEQRQESAEEEGGRERAAELARSVDNKVMQDFYDAARDQGLWREREFAEGELSEGFNDAAEFEQRAGQSGDDEESFVPATGLPTPMMMMMTVMMIANSTGVAAKLKNSE